MYKKLSTFIFLTVIIGIVTIGFFARYENGNGVRKVNTNDQYKYIAANQILMWVSNNGDGSHDPRTDGNGFYWPGGEDATLSAVFQDGLIFAGKVGREIRMNGNTHRQGLQAGKILDTGEPDDPSLDKYRVYRIKKGWENLAPGDARDQFEKDYNEWPMADGAPYEDVDGNGAYTENVDVPAYIGDEVLFYLANDMDPARSTQTYGTLPMGLEFQTTIFAFSRTGDLGDILFKKYTIINKGNNTIRDMILGYWSDTDLGNASDDYTGCDTTLSLGYTYNGDENDEDAYGSPPPAMGYDFFQGPIIPSTDPMVAQLGLPDSAKFLGKWRKNVSNLPMTAFAFYINPDQVYRDPSQGVAQGSIEFYNYLQGLVWDGNPFIDPNTGQESKFVLTGDPVAGTGWYEGDGWPGGPAPNDRRHLMASGPFTMAPGDTQEIVVGMLIALGTDSKNSVTELKRKDGVAQIAYDLDFNLTPPPPAPKTSYYVDDEVVTIYWEDNAESYDTLDVLLAGKGLADSTYSFEGYRMWQYSSQAGNDPRVIATWDISNGIKVIYNYQAVNGIQTLVPELVLADEGIQRFYTINTDIYSNTALRNGTPYYFSVTSFGYCPNSVPTYLESPASIFTVIPARKKIDYTSPYSTNEAVYAGRVEGFGDAKVNFKIIDPEGLTGDTYRVEIGGAVGALTYNLINKTQDDTLIKDGSRFVALQKDDFGDWVVPRNDTLGAPLYQGFQFMIQDEGADSIKVVPNLHKVKAITEVKGPGGADLANPVDVWDSYNSTRKWQIVSKNLGTFIWQSPNTQEGLGYDTYEIRFTGTSQYYITGYAFSFTPTLKSDTLAYEADGVTPATLPFQVWDLGMTPDDPSDDVRLTIKVLDNDRSNPNRAIPDKKYTQFPNGDWEELFFYDSNGLDNDNLPALSGLSKNTDHKFGNFVFRGDLPEAGTVIRMTTWTPLQPGAVFETTLKAAEQNNTSAAQANIDKISVFPNPYFGSNSIETDKYRRFVRFIGLPKKVTVRIYSLSGVFVQRIEKEDNSQFLDWNLLNGDNLPVASGIYLAYLDMPGVGTKVMKIAIIQEQQYIDRL